MGKKKIILPPQLPPDVAEDEIDVSDEDLQFVKENRKFAGFLKGLDTQSITKQVTRVADVKEDAIEALYEKQRIKKKSLESSENKRNDEGLEVDPVDALPVKTLDGKLYYKTAPKESRKPANVSKDDERTTADDETDNKSVVKLTKVERRAKLKKSKKEAKKQVKESDNNTEEDVQGRTPQAEVLAEVKEDLSSEELFARKRSKLAELGMALLADPESNIKSLKDLMQISKDEDHNITKLGMLSLLAVFKDIIPGYRIRLPTEKEMEMTISKAVKKMRFYESTLLSSYKAYLQKLVALEKLSSFKHVAVRCMCSLLDAVPHFNFRENLLEAVVNNLSSPDDVIRKLCCTTLKSLFANEGKHGGEVTVDAVQLIAKLVKVHDCQLHPDTIEVYHVELDPMQHGHGCYVTVVNLVCWSTSFTQANSEREVSDQVFLSLSFDEDLGKAEFSKGGKMDKKGKKKSEESSKIKKRNRKDLQIQSKEEVDAELKAASFATDRLEQKKMQSETLSAIFQTYFRILKQTSQNRYKVGTGSLFGGFGANPLLAPCLNGLGKFSHLIDLDFMGDLMNSLKDLASGGGNPDNSAENSLTVSERLRCCIVAFKVMRNNLDALNVDLHEFFVQLYNLLLEYRPERDQGEVLADALKTMLCEGRQHDMQRAAAFIKRLATFALCFGSAEAMAALVTLKDLLQKNIKCRNLLENDAGGGSLSGSVAGYQPCASDPNQSGAFASVLWELSLLSKHYHPTVSTAASSISSMANPDHQVYLPFTSPRQAFVDLLVEKEAFNLKNSNLGTSNRKRKTSGSSVLNADKTTFDLDYSVDEEDLKRRMSEHFTVLRDIADNERLRRELNLTGSSISLYEEYKKQKKRKKQGDSKAIKR